ncbi:hypothetical protein DERP_015314 [Dermatophagoides pteronyssinus]|uniref:Uncharacterized protein n=1 Tax=Dermatophagoides pteronyssinus TaxID=6956 RepID=A0ABQ8JUB5_DERPT|nr:hypothetical protein DERP_015314 [Dermatophagoides pteronyssinus]
MHFLLDSTISTSYSSARSNLMLAATKPSVSCGTHTNRLADHSAVFVGSETTVRSTAKYLKSDSIGWLLLTLLLLLLLLIGLFWESVSVRAGDMMIIGVCDSTARNPNESNDNYECHFDCCDGDDDWRMFVKKSMILGRISV